jgi:hypothetical protein
MGRLSVIWGIFPIALSPISTPQARVSSKCDRPEGRHSASDRFDLNCRDLAQELRAKKAMPEAELFGKVPGKYLTHINEARAARDESLNGTAKCLWGRRNEYCDRTAA